MVDGVSEDAQEEEEGGVGGEDAPDPVRNVFDEVPEFLWLEGELDFAVMDDEKAGDEGEKRERK